MSAGNGSVPFTVYGAGDLTKRRLDGYHRLQRENAYSPSRSDARLRTEQEKPNQDLARIRRAIKEPPRGPASSPVTAGPDR